MTIKDFLITEPHLMCERELATEATTISQDFLEAIENRQSPPAMLEVYLPLFRKIDIKWKTNCRKHLKSGRTTKSILLQSLPTYSLSQFALDKLNFTFHHQHNFTRMQFNYTSYIEMCKMELAMLIYKYEQVYRFEMYVAFIRLLLQYFNVYVENGYTMQTQWEMTAREIYNAITTILDMQLSELKPYTDLIDANYAVIIKPQVNEPKHIKLHPTCADDLLMCRDEGMT